MSDEKIQRLLDSDDRQDMILGRVFLLKKYPKILKNSRDHWHNDYSIWNVDSETVEKYSPIIMKKTSRISNNITGFVIKKELLND